MKRVLLLAAGVVVLLSNAWVLVSAWQNRGDAPGGTIELTERELRLVPISNDSTAALLQLRWETRTTEPGDDRAPAWLDAAKLQELGFDCRVSATNAHAHDHYGSLPARLLYGVLQLDAEAPAQAGGRGGSRLSLVDVGQDPKQLRASYPDPARHLITHVVVRPFLKERNRKEGSPVPESRLSAWVGPVLPEMIFVPPPHHRFLQNLNRPGDSPGSRDQKEAPPRYAAVVSWGRNYEPWVRSLRPLPAMTPSK